MVICQALKESYSSPIYPQNIVVLSNSYKPQEYEGVNDRPLNLLFCLLRKE